MDGVPADSGRDSPGSAGGTFLARGDHLPGRGGALPAASSDGPASMGRENRAGCSLGPYRISPK